MVVKIRKANLRVCLVVEGDSSSKLLVLGSSICVDALLCTQQDVPQSARDAFCHLDGHQLLFSLITLNMQRKEHCK